MAFKGRGRIAGAATFPLEVEWSFDEYLDVVRVIKKNFPKIQIKAYTAVEIDFFFAHGSGTYRRNAVSGPRAA